jgi:hypothetical protein
MKLGLPLAASVSLATALVIAGARPGRACAQDAPERARTSALGWVRLPGAEGCPTAQDVAQAVEERLGRAVLVAASDAELAIEGRVERVGEPPGFRAVVRIADAGGAVLGERTLEQAGDDCTPLLAPLALAIALTIDPEAQATVHSEPAPPAVDSQPAIAPPPWRMEITLGPIVALGLGPSVAPGGTAAFFLTPPGFVPIVIAGSLFPWSRAERAGGVWIDHLIALAGVGLCPLALRDDRAAFLACARIDVGAMAVVGRSGALALAEHERVLAQLDVSARAHVRIVGPLMFHVGLALLIPFRGEPYLEGGVAYHRPEPIAGALDLGIGLDLDL